MTCVVWIFGVGKFGLCFVKFNVEICVYLFGFWSPNLIRTRNLTNKGFSFFFFLAKLFMVLRMGWVFRIQIIIFIIYFFEREDWNCYMYFFVKNIRGATVIRFFLFFI